MEISSGSTVGGYRIVRLLGQGAMGAVYEAQHPTLPRRVALKVLNPVVAHHPELRQRFEREADLLCALEHPNVVDALDRGQDGDRLYIAMRFVDGTDLDTALRERGPFAPAQAVEVVATVGRALDHAHARGLLHRDVKPANIMLRRGADGTEEAVLTDFGIAKDLTADAGLTADGGVPGTFPYTAPERLEGRAADGRSDVYSLGAVLFELLTGRRAYPMDELAPLFAAKVMGPVPDVVELRPDLPPALAAVVTRALQKDPAGRFATCAELAAAARAALAPRPPAPPTTIGIGAGTAPPGPPPPGTAPPGAQPEEGGRTPTRRDPRPGQPAPPPAPRRVRWVPVVLALALLAGLVTVVAVLAGGGDGDRGDQGGGTTADGGTTAQDPPGAVTPSDDDDGGEPGSGAGAALAVGDCLDASSAPTACDGAHATEVYATGECPPAALLDYLGGRPGTDVLRQDLVLGTAGAACTVGLPDADLDGSSAGVLDGPADEWRRCLDDDGAELPCSQPHAAEVVFEQQAPTDALNCTARAGEYLGAPFSRHVADLVVREAGTTCVVEARGSNVLTASLRDLGSRALPLEAD
ncbi:serine/threonine-protein kinase [Trujillonella humicola]|uniref:serine/threonine-protein kinase n=1 Tax=Trujillonella humicola TaxID=3383699 RepID=UPI003906816F